MSTELRWFMVSTKAKLENKAKESIEKAIKQAKKESMFGQVVVPTIEETSLVKGEKKTKLVARYPNYILVQMVPSNENLMIVRSAQHVNGFVGDNRQPKPLSDVEVSNMLAVESKTKTTASTSFYEGELVKIIDGPFKDFVGNVDTVKADKLKVVVLVTVFGRATPVELGFDQVVKEK